MGIFYLNISLVVRFAVDKFSTQVDNVHIQYIGKNASDRITVVNTLIPVQPGYGAVYFD